MVDCDKMDQWCDWCRQPFSSENIFARHCSDECERKAARAEAVRQATPATLDACRKAREPK